MYLKAINVNGILVPMEYDTGKGIKSYNDLIGLALQSNNTIVVGDTLQLCKVETQANSNLYVPLFISNTKPLERYFNDIQLVDLDENTLPYFQELNNISNMLNVPAMYYDFYIKFTQQSQQPQQSQPNPQPPQPEPQPEQQQEQQEAEQQEQVQLDEVQEQLEPQQEEQQPQPEQQQEEVQEQPEQQPEQPQQQEQPNVQDREIINNEVESQPVQESQPEPQSQTEQEQSYIFNQNQQETQELPLISNEILQGTINAAQTQANTQENPIASWDSTGISIVSRNDMEEQINVQTNQPQSYSTASHLSVEEFISLNAGKNIKLTVDGDTTVYSPVIQVVENSLFGAVNMSQFTEAINEYNEDSRFLSSETSLIIKNMETFFKIYTPTINLKDIIDIFTKINVGTQMLYLASHFTPLEVPEDGLYCGLYYPLFIVYTYYKLIDKLQEINEDLILNKFKITMSSIYASRIDAISQDAEDDDEDDDEIAYSESGLKETLYNVNLLQVNINAGRIKLTELLFQEMGFNDIRAAIQNTINGVKNQYSNQVFKDIKINGINYNIKPDYIDLTTDRDEDLCVEALAIYINEVSLGSRGNVDKSMNYNDYLKVIRNGVGNGLLTIDIGRYNTIETEKMMLKPIYAVYANKTFPLAMVYENIAESATIVNRYVILPVAGNFLNKLSTMFNFTEANIVSKIGIGNGKELYTMTQLIHQKATSKEVGVMSLKVDLPTKENPQVGDILEKLENSLSSSPKIRGSYIPKQILDETSSTEILYSFKVHNILLKQQ